MFKKIGLLFIVFTLVSCSSTVIDKKSKRAFRNDSDIVWNQAIHRPHWLTGAYDAKNMFTDDEKAHAAMKDSERENSRGVAFLWTGVGAAVTYLLASSNPSQGKYYGIFVGVGILPFFYYQIRRTNKIDKMIKDYNNRKGYSFGPMLFNDGKKSKLGGGLTFSF